MGQPPHLGHFTNKLSVSITAVAPNLGAPPVDNDLKTWIVPA